MHHNSDDSLASGSNSISLWKVAVNATKGLLHLNPPSSSVDSLESLDSESSRSTRVSSGSKPSSSSTRTLRKPRSSPSLKHSERRVISGPLPALPNTLSSTSPPSRRSRNSSHSRPQISHPLPHPLDPHNPKLSSPSLVNLSSNNTYNNTSYSTSTSQNVFVFPTSCQSSSRVGAPRDLAVARRRTKSASNFQSDRLKYPSSVRNAQYLDVSPSFVYSPAFSTASSASLQTPKSSTVNLMDPYASPKSVSSVKRKPVPRYLYNETGSTQASPQHNHPATQSLQSMSSAGEDGSIGTTLPLSFKKGTKSGRNQGNSSHQHSLSECGGSNPPTTWARNLQDSAVDMPPASSTVCRTLIATPPNGKIDVKGSPDSTASSATVGSEDELRSSALSPLTDEEIVVCRAFVGRHTAGQRARQRRQRPLTRRWVQQSESESEPYMRTNSHHVKPFDRDCGSYTANAEIFAAYLESSDALHARSSSIASTTTSSSVDPGPDEDSDGHSQTPSSETSESKADARPFHTGAVIPLAMSHSQARGRAVRPSAVALEIDTGIITCDAPETGVSAEDDSDASTSLVDELETPVDGSNRRTFGYCGSEFGLGIAAPIDEPHHKISNSVVVAPGRVERDDCTLRETAWSGCRPARYGIDDPNEDGYVRGRNAYIRPNATQQQQSPKPRTRDFLRGVDMCETNAPVNSDITSLPNRAVPLSNPSVATGMMGVPILAIDKLSRLEAGDVGRHSSPSSPQRGSATLQRAFLVRGSPLGRLRSEDEVEGSASDSGAFGALRPFPRPISSSSISQSDTSDMAPSFDSISSYERLQTCLSKLKTYAPSPTSSGFQRTNGLKVRSPHSSAVQINGRRTPDSRSQMMDDSDISTGSRLETSIPRKHFPPLTRANMVAFDHSSESLVSPTSKLFPIAPPCSIYSRSSASVSAHSLLRVTPNTDKDSDSGLSHRQSKLPLKKFFAGLKGTTIGKS